jgi:hypothetical protein
MLHRDGVLNSLRGVLNHPAVKWRGSPKVGEKIKKESKLWSQRALAWKSFWVTP